MVAKYNDLLEEENLDFLEIPDKIEVDIAKAKLLENENLIEDAMEIILNSKEKVERNQLSIEKKIIADYYQTLAHYRGKWVSFHLSLKLNY